MWLPRFPRGQGGELDGLLFRGRPIVSQVADAVAVHHEVGADGVDGTVDGTGVDGVVVVVAGGQRDNAVDAEGKGAIQQRRSGGVEVHQGHGDAWEEG